MSNPLSERNTIHHCDIFELCAAQGDGSVDMILCDLPYGTTDLKNGKTGVTSWDNIIPILPMFEAFRRILSRIGTIVLTATEPFASQLRMSALDLYKYDWIWEKTRGTSIMHAKNRPNNIFENVLVFSKGAINHEGKTNRRMTYNPQMVEGKPYKVSVDPVKRIGTYVGIRPSHVKYTRINEGERYPTSIIKINNDNSDNIHPTQKPLELFSYLIKTYSKEGDLILDPTCGSGTTAHAAWKTGRDFICGDITQEYVELARQRLANADPYQAKTLSSGKKQLSLFSGGESE